MAGVTCARSLDPVDKTRGLGMTQSFVVAGLEGDARYFLESFLEALSFDELSLDELSFALSDFVLSSFFDSLPESLEPESLADAGPSFLLDESDELDDDPADGFLA